MGSDGWALSSWPLPSLEKRAASFCCVVSQASECSWDLLAILSVALLFRPVMNQFGLFRVR